MDYPDEGIQVPCGPIQCCCRYVNGKHRPHPGRCLMSVSSVDWLSGRQICLPTPGIVERDDMVRCLSEQLNVPTRLLNVVWDGSRCCVIFRKDGLVDAPFVLNNDFANPDVCFVCCDSFYRGRWTCSECHLEELCANCHVVTHGGVLCYFCIMERQERHEVLNRFELHEFAARDTLRYQLLERCWSLQGPLFQGTAVATLTDTAVQQTATGDLLGASLSLLANHIHNSCELNDTAGSRSCPARSHPADQPHQGEPVEAHQPSASSGEPVVAPTSNPMLQKALLEACEAAATLLETLETAATRDDNELPAGQDDTTSDAHSWTLPAAMPEPALLP